MEININERESYFKGEAEMRLYNFTRARYWYEKVCLQNGELKDMALSKIMHIDLCEGEYARVRSILNEHDQGAIKFKQIYGLLDSIENNYERSRHYYKECLSNPSMQNQALLSMAKTYIQTADYQMAEKMLETLQWNEKYYVRATFSLVCLNLLQKNDQYAYQLLKTIDKRNLSPKLARQYDNMEGYILYCLGQLKGNNDIDSSKNYMLYQLIHPSEENLLRHIENHLDQNERFTNGCFFKYTDLKKLLIDVRDKVEYLNPNHFEMTDMYRFRLDTPIGFKRNQITNDLCVVTFLGTKDIITMYPVALSDEFDIENATTSKQLAKKRIENGGYRR